MTNSEKLRKVYELRHELECLLHYLKWLQEVKAMCDSPKYGIFNGEERVKQGLEYLYEFDLFGEETYNGWLWDDIPFTIDEILQQCIDKVNAYIEGFDITHGTM